MKTKDVTMLDLIIVGEYLEGFVDLEGGWQRTPRGNGFAFDHNDNEWGIRVINLYDGKYLIEEIIYDRSTEGFMYDKQSKEDLVEINLYNINKFLADKIASVYGNAEELWE